jgi:hypothetical protein
MRFWEMRYGTKWFGALFLGPLVAGILANVSGHPDLLLWFILPCSVAGFLFGRMIDQQDEARDEKGSADTIAQTPHPVGWQQIVRAYGAFLEQWFKRRDFGAIYDVELLPYPKAEIEHALVTGIITVKNARVLDSIDPEEGIELPPLNDARMRDWLEAALVTLADFQESVGTEPLSLRPGFADALQEFERSDRKDEARNHLIRQIAAADHSEKVDQKPFIEFQAKVRADQARYSHLIAQARAMLK